MKYDPTKANHNRRISPSGDAWRNRTFVPLNPKEIKTAKDGRKYFLVDGKVNFVKGSRPTK